MVISQIAKSSVLGVEVSVAELLDVVDAVLEAARSGRSLGVSALAVHGVMLATEDPELRHRVNSLDVVTPDGQPVRWALNWLHRADLSERVTGPDLMWEVCRQAADEGQPIFLFGSTHETLSRLQTRLLAAFSQLDVAGIQASRFRGATEAEAAADIATIQASGARIVFVGLGCPRQEIWAYENRDSLRMPLLAVGAAFDYHAGLIRRAPNWMQRWGLEWTYRLVQDPKRLWKRYLLLNPRYLGGVALQSLGLRNYRSVGRQPEAEIRPG